MDVGLVDFIYFGVFHQCIHHLLPTTLISEKRCHDFYLLSSLGSSDAFGDRFHIFMRFKALPSPFGGFSSSVLIVRGLAVFKVPLSFFGLASFFVKVGGSRDYKLKISPIVFNKGFTFFFLIKTFDI